MSGVAIAPVAAADLPDIAALARTVWQATYPGIITQAQIDQMFAQRYNLPSLTVDLENEQKWLDQAFVEGARVGFAQCEISDGEYKLDRLYVLPEAQRRGVGGALIAHVAARARELGFPAVVLRVNKRNERAVNAYRKHGFAVREAVVEDIGNGFVMDDYLMEKLL